MRKYRTDLNAGDTTAYIKARTGQAMPCFISRTRAHAPFFASQQNRWAGNIAGFRHNILPIITRLSFHSSITDNIYLLQCEFQLIRLWDTANVTYNHHTYTCDLPLLSIHSTIHLVQHEQRLMFVLSRADLIHMKHAGARNLSSITVNCNQLSYADGLTLWWHVVKTGHNDFLWISTQARVLKKGVFFFLAWTYDVTSNKLTPSTTTCLTPTVCNQSQYIT